MTPPQKKKPTKKLGKTAVCEGGLAYAAVSNRETCQQEQKKGAAAFEPQDVGLEEPPGMLHPPPPRYHTDRTGGTGGPRSHSR